MLNYIHVFTNNIILQILHLFRLNPLDQSVYHLCASTNIAHFAKKLITMYSYKKTGTLWYGYNLLFQAANLDTSGHDVQPEQWSCYLLGLDSSHFNNQWCFSVKVVPVINRLYGKNSLNCVFTQLRDCFQQGKFNSINKNRLHFLLNLYP